MDDILETLEQRTEAVAFEDLFPYPSRSFIVTTLLAILQLLKLNKISCEQRVHFEPIYVYRKDYV